MFKEIPGVTVLHIASKENNEPEIIDLLVKSGANVNAQDAEGFTPLHMATIHGNVKIVKKLVDLEADVNIVTTDGKTAAELGHLNQELEIEEYLQSKMACSQRTKEKEVDFELAGSDEERVPWLPETFLRGVQFLSTGPPLLLPTVQDVSTFGQHRKFPPHGRKRSGTQGRWMDG